MTPSHRTPPRHAGLPGATPGRVAVIGITGQVGSRVASRLARRGVKVRGVARHPYDYTGTRRVELVSADCRIPQEARRAVEGATAVYLTPPLGRRTPLQDQRKVVSNVIEASRDAGVQHIVMHTALHAKKGDTGARVVDEKAPLEARLKASGVPFTILRPGWFLDNLLAERETVAGGSLVLPVPPERRIGVVASRDVAKAAVAFLEQGPQNRGFDLHVPDGVEAAQLAEAATAALHQPVVYREATVEEFVQTAPEAGEQRALQQELYEYLHDHDFVGKPDDVRNAIPGFQYMSPRRFMERKLLPVAAASQEPPPVSPWLPTPEPVPALRPHEDGPPGEPHPPPGPQLFLILP